MKGFILTLSQLLFSLSMYLMGVVYFGISLAPGLYIFFTVLDSTAAYHIATRYILLGMSLALGYFLFGFTLILLTGTTRTLLCLRLKEGVHRIFSPQGVKWAFVSSLYLLIRFTFINFILLTPFAPMLLRLLGAKVGKNVQVNSQFVFDATLLEIGDNTVVGGDSIIIGHVVERGLLKLKKVKIGKNVTIGSNATITPGCEIGDNAIIGAGAVLLKNTKVEPRSVWYGIPAENIRKKKTPQKEEGER